MAEIPRIIHHNQLLSIKFGRILGYVKNDGNCAANCQIIESLIKKTWWQGMKSCKPHTCKWKGYHFLIECVQKGYLFFYKWWNKIKIWWYDIKWIKCLYERVRDWTSEWNLPVRKFVEYLPGVCIKMQASKPWSPLKTHFKTRKQKKL